MTQASEIITQAFREANIIPIGRTPSEAEQAEALPRLNNFISWLFGTKLGEFKRDWPIPPNRKAPVPAQFPLFPEERRLPDNVWPYPPNNARLLVSISSASTVFLPYSPNPGAQLSTVNVGASADITLNANGRLIDDLASIVLTPEEFHGLRWFYREDLGSWRRISSLSLTEESPLPAEFDDLLVCALAIRLAPRFGAEPLAATAQTYTDSLAKLEQRYKQYMPVGANYDLTMQTRQSFDNDFWPDEGSLYGA